MKYMNLRFAIEHKRVCGYELANALRLDPANFSRRLRGRPPKGIGFDGGNIDRTEPFQLQNATKFNLTFRQLRF
jgi:hypothetical protein